jgi:hypothetical protein
MTGFLKASDKDHASFGRVLTSWVYKPQKSKRFLFYILGVVVALGIFLVTYGSRFLPLLEKIPETLLYIVFLALGPLLNLFKSVGKVQEWTLFERGFSVKYSNEGKGTGDEKYVLWEKFKSCTYDSNSVTLLPAQKVGRKIKMRASVNAMEIYSICRERISIAQAQVLHRPNRAPSTPNTPEQRRIAKLEKDYSRSISTKNYKWKT